MTWGGCGAGPRPGPERLGAYNAERRIRCYMSTVPTRTLPMIATTSSIKINNYVLCTPADPTSSRSWPAGSATRADREIRLIQRGAQALLSTRNTREQLLSPLSQSLPAAIGPEQILQEQSLENLNGSSLCMRSCHIHTLNPSPTLPCSLPAPAPSRSSTDTAQNCTIWPHLFIFEQSQIIVL